MSEKYTTTIDGVEYDITEFMKTHPGGDNMLILAAGRDASILFHSYHRFV
jgi:cytochrome b involved in lipid metabolism